MKRPRHRPPAGLLRAFGLLVSGFCLLATGCTTRPAVSHRTVLPEQATAVTIPAEIVDGQFFVVTRWDGLGPWRFLVDTGSTVTLVSPEFAHAYAGDEPAADMATVRVRSADGGSAHLPGVRVRSLALGAARFENVTALVYDFDELSAHYGLKIDGLLGYTLFRDTVLTLDYPHAQLGLVPAVSAPALPGRVLPLLGDWSRPVVAAQLGDRPLAVLLDTGSSGALRLNPGIFPPRLAAPARPGATVATLTGDRQQEIGRLADDFVLGGRTFTRPVVELTDQPAAVGSEVLRHFRITLDAERGLASLIRDGDDPIGSDPLRSTGISLRRFPAYWRVVSIVAGSPADDAGLESGDLITRINGERVEKWGLDRYEALVRAAPAVDFTLLNGRTETTEHIPTFPLVP
ncbi:MAG: aspartyl protease family protein [Verrucomicrobiota bacterium]